MANIDYSVIVPVLNEERSVKELYYKLKEVLTSLKKEYEIIFIDDGSTDNTLKNIKEIKKTDKRLKIISFQRRFGKSAAYSAGFRYAKAPIIITMDGDLQDDPRDIPKFLYKISNYDLVVGWKYNRKDPFTKKLASKIFNFLNYLLFGVKLHDSDCGFKAIKKRVAEKLKLYSDLYRYIPALVDRLGYKITEVKIVHHKRKYGKSKYTSFRLITGALDLLTVKFLTKYLKKPLHLFGLVGILSFIIGFFAEIYVLYFKIIRNEPFSVHMPMLIFGVLLIILGVQFFGIGLIGEMVSSQEKEEGYLIKEFVE